MTTAALPSVDWIRLTIGDDELSLVPSPGIELRLLVAPVPHDGNLDPLTVGHPPQIRFTVDLVPTAAGAVHRCEAEARRVGEALGANGPADGLLREFSLEAALGGDGLPYNRVSAPRLTLLSGEPPLLDEEQAVPGVRVFAATAHSAGDDGSKCWMRLVN
jgi:hypothetical protein